MLLPYQLGHPRCTRRFESPTVTSPLDVLLPGCTMWSNVAPNSGEAELNALIHGTIEGLGIRDGRSSVVMTPWLRCRCDSTAALGELSRMKVEKLNASRSQARLGSGACETEFCGAGQS